MIDSSFSFAGIAGAMALAISASVVAEDAVQWTEAEGGNGHWYQVVAISEVTWDQADAAARTAGGELVSIQSSGENNFVFVNCASYDPAWLDGVQTSFGPWIGGIEIDGEWTWTDGSEWKYDNWADFQPSGTPAGTGRVHFHNMWTESPTSTWNDTGLGTELNGYVAEWSADCDGDGVVDYGQILDGTYQDLNGNGVPDDCETTDDAGYEAAVMASEPIAYWRMEIEQGVVANHVPGSPAAVANGSPTVDETAVGCIEDRSLRMNGNSHLVVPDDDRFDLDALGDFSVEAWVRLPALDDEMIVSRSRDVNAGNWDLRTYGFGDGLLEFRITYIGHVLTAWRPEWTDTWIHVVGVADEAAGTISLYVNGVLEREVELYGGPLAGSSNYPLLIGRHNIRGMYAWNAIGSIDEVAIYDRPLDDDEILSHYLNADPSKSCDVQCLGDLNLDGMVGPPDLGMLLALWGTDGSPIGADINGDGTVDASDLGPLLGAWGVCP